MSLTILHRRRLQQISESELNFNFLLKEGGTSFPLVGDFVSWMNGGSGTLSVDSVEDYQVLNNNVRLNINGSYIERAGESWTIDKGFTQIIDKSEHPEMFRFYLRGQPIVYAEVTEATTSERELAHSNSTLKKIRLDNVLFFKSYRDFVNCVSLKRLYIPRVNQWSNQDPANFITGTTNLTIYTHPMWENNLPVELSNAVNTQGATIVFVQNFNAPSVINNLTYSGGTLNFTPPTSVNGIDFYEVFVNDFHHSEITGSGAAITLNAGDKVFIYACDIYYNRSKSNTITI